MPSTRAVTPSITSEVLATSISMIVTSPGCTGTSGGRSSVRTSGHAHAALERHDDRPRRIGLDHQLVAGDGGDDEAPGQVDGRRRRAARSRRRRRPPDRRPRRRRGARRTPSAPRCRVGDSCSSNTSTGGPAGVNTSVSTAATTITAMPGLSWPSRTAPTSGCSSPARAISSCERRAAARNAVGDERGGDLAVGQHRAHQPRQQGPLVAVVRCPRRDQEAQLDAWQRRAGARAARRARSPRRRHGRVRCCGGCPTGTG